MLARASHSLMWLPIVLLGLAWPLLTHALLPRIGAWPLLIAVAALAWWRLPVDRRRWGWGLLALLALVWLTDAGEFGLRLWPVLVNLVLLAIFAHGLRHPPSPVERLARRRQPNLPAHAVRYVRGVTRLWCGFFACNAAMALITALYADLRLWSLYNGVVVYALMALLFAGEWCVRQRVQRRHADAAYASSPDSRMP